MNRMPLLQRFIPFLNWSTKVNKKTLRLDIVAGLTGAVIVLPQGVAFAMIAGLPPEYGLYTAMITPIIAALFGSSHHLISGPTTAISIVVFAAVSQFAEPGSPDFIRLALALALYAGIIQLILGLARMGTLVNFVSHTVVIAFTAGAALLIATSQVKHVLGISIERGLPFFENWGEIFLQLKNTNTYVLFIAAITLGSAIFLKKLWPKLPYMLFAMLIGSIAGMIIQGDQHGVMLVGKLPNHLPPPSLPDISFDTMRQLAPNAFAIALLGLVEAVSIARAIATHTQQRIDGNQEFIGQGLSNIVGSFFSSYPGSGSFTRSGVNHQAGAETPLSAIFSAVFLALILLFVAPLTAYLPIPAMGGIILLVAYNLIDFRHIKGIIATSKRESIILLVTFLSTLFLELEFAIYMGVIFSLIFYLQKTSKPRAVTMAPNPDAPRRQFVNIARVPAEECPQLKVIRIDGSLFFGAIDHITVYLNALRENHPSQKNLLILANGINFIDLEGADLLEREAKKWRENNGDLFLSGLKKPGRELLKKSGAWDTIGADHIFWSKQDAIKIIFPLLDKKICETCTRRIFLECRSNQKRIFQEDLSTRISKKQ